jgi:hexokinase
MISGMYLGEITRNVLLSLVDAAPKSLLFDGKTTAALNAQWGFDTSVMSGVEEAWEGKGSKETPPLATVPQLADFEAPGKLDAGVKARLERVRAVLVKDLGFKEADVSLRDAAVSLGVAIQLSTHVHTSFQIVRWASSLIARRAALLSGVAVATVLIQTGRAVLSGQSGKPTKNEPKIGVGVDGRLVSCNFLRSPVTQLCTTV